MFCVGEYREVDAKTRLVHTESLADADGNAMTAEQMGMPAGAPMETSVVDEPDLRRYPLASCLAEPQVVVDSLARWARDYDRVLVHVDIDVLDGAQFPIADNTREDPGLSLSVLR